MGAAPPHSGGCRELIFHQNHRLGGAQHACHRTTQERVARSARFCGRAVPGVQSARDMERQRIAPIKISAFCSHAVRSKGRLGQKKIWMFFTYG